MTKIARHHTLIAVDGIKALKRHKVSFKCRYDLVGLAQDGMPKYTCIYEYDDEEAILVLSRLGELGAEAREFKLWPGLFRHHEEYGDGSVLCIHKDLNITCVRNVSKD